MKKSTLDENKAHDKVEWWDPQIDVYSLSEKTAEIDKFKQKPAYSSFYSIFCTWEIKEGADIDEEKTILSHFCICYFIFESSWEKVTLKDYDAVQSIYHGPWLTAQKTYKSFHINYANLAIIYIEVFIWLV
jgi:hypothetical protein